MSESKPRLPPVAIIGIAGRFPGADNPRELFANLLAGTDSISHFEDGDLEDGSSSEERTAAGFVKARPVLENVELFDAAFFGMQPREAELTDPQQRVFLECAWEALEDAAYDPSRYSGAIGVFGGCSMNTYFLQHVLRDRGTLEEFTRSFQVGCYPMLVGAGLDFLATRVAYKLDLRGPAITLQSACSTSLLAVSQACQSLQLDQCDMALAGGVSISFPQKRGYQHQAGGMVSADGHCRPFDADASGTVFGSGAAVVLLKRLDRAQADGDHIYAVIRGCGVNNDGATKVAFTAPSVDGQAKAIRCALDSAGVGADSISYIECHGTATPLGDPIELAALTQAFRTSTPERQFCAIGSIKANVGHLDAAAGATGLIKVALALKQKMLPASLHYRRPNPQIDFAASPFFVQAASGGWPQRGGGPRRAGVSSLGVGGTNVHIVMEEAPAPAAVRSVRETPQLLLLSARSGTALVQACGRLAAHLQAQPDLALCDVAHTLREGRRAFGNRLSLHCRDRDDAIAQLTGAAGAAAALSHRGEAARSPPLAFMFPGQGAQYAGMSRGLYRDEPTFRAELDRCAGILRPQMDIDLRELLHGADDEAAQLRLQQTGYAQPALFAVEYSLARLLMSRGLRAAAMIGHSVGEFVAAVLAGVMSLEDALLVVAQRGRLMQTLPAGAMLAVRLTAAKLEPLLPPDCSLAAVNAPGLCVAAGPLASIAALEKLLTAQGAISRRLHTSHAFHSPMVDPVIEPLHQLLAEVRLSAPEIPCISCVTGEWLTADQATSPEYWAGHARATVRFADGIAKLAQAATTLLEAGPGDSLSRLARQADRNLQLRAIATLPGADAAHEDREQLEAALGGLWVAGASPDWRAWLADEGKRVPLPAYPFERRRHWIDAPAHGTFAAAAPPLPVAAAGPEIAGDGIKADPATAGIVRIIEQLSGQQLPPSQEKTSFLEMGFDSLFLAQVTQRIQSRLQVEVSFRQLLGELNTVAALSAHIAARQPARLAANDARMAPAPAPAAVPLTESQMEIWLASQAGDSASCAFNQSMTLRLHGPLNRDALLQALRHVVERHESLRLHFSATGEEMQLQSPHEPDCPYEDLSAGGEDAAEAGLQARVAADALCPFDLTGGPLLRLGLLRLAQDRHALVFSSHHIVCDGWSLNVIARELAQCYESACRGRQPELSPPASFLQYASQEGERNPAEREATESWWLKRFEKLPAPASLPADRPRPAQRSFRGARYRCRVDAALAARLKRAGAQLGATPFLTLLSLYQVLIGRLAGENEVVVGVPTAGQRLQEGGALVGHCVHFLPIRAGWDAKTSLAAHIEKQVHDFTEAAGHPRYTLATLLRGLELKSERARRALSEVQFNLETRLDRLNAGELGIEAEANARKFVNSDLCLNVLESADGLTLDCDYCIDLFDQATVALWMDCYRCLLQAFVEQPQQPLLDAPMLPPETRQRVLHGFNATAATYRSDLAVHQLIDRCAGNHPDAPALRCGGKSLSHLQVRERSNRLAQYLLQGLAGPRERIGILMERSVDLPVAMLAVLKAGCAYVPLDPSHPPARLQRIIADAGLAALITDHASAAQLLEAPLRLIRLDLEADAVGQMPAVPPAVPTAPDAPAYVIYTSGSTGRPKGVQLHHRGVVNFLSAMAREPGMDAHDVLLAVTTVSFDIAVLELLLPLVTGGCAVIARGDEVADGSRLRQYLERDGITLMQATPATWSLLLAAGYRPPPGLRMLCGGEALPRDLANRLLEHGGELWNMYGPTETTVWSSCLKVATGETPITIGRPIANTCFYVLDRKLQPQPPGVPGELYIGGDGVADGYHRMPALTAEKFTGNPWAPGRLYRSGDLARCLDDGQFQVLGRLDHQVKLRGFRIELGEIEAALRRQAAIADAAVVLREDHPGAPRLCAYYVARKAPCTAASLRSALQQDLPEYMVPSAWTALEALPRLPNGKLDRASLPEPDQASAGIEYVAPVSALEQRLARIWGEVLLLEHVSTGLDLFDFGADSIQLFQISARAHREGMRLSARQLLEHRTIAALARHLQDSVTEKDLPQPLSLAQFRQRRQPAAGSVPETSGAD